VQVSITFKGTHKELQKIVIMLLTSIYFKAAFGHSIPSVFDMLTLQVIVVRRANGIPE
jgi:hypothetical protein